MRLEKSPITMEDDSIRLNNAIFTILKPVCDRLIVDVNENSITNFTRVVDTLPPKAIQKFQSYICFPIELQIIKLSSSQQKQVLVDLLCKVISRCYIDSVDILLRLSTLLYQQVVTNDQTKVAEVAEELKLSVVLCIIQVWKSAIGNVLYNVYNKETLPRISSIVYMLVQLAKNEKLIKLRVSALECLQVLCQVHSDRHTDDAESNKRVREIIKLIFPGVISCCFTIASEPATLNHKVTCANLLLWSGLLVLTMADTETSADPQHADWLANTTATITPLMEVVLCAQTHTHWQVRQVLVSAVQSLLSLCSKNMSSSVGSLVCCLIVLSEDEMSEVRVPAASSLSQLSATFHHDTGQSLLQLVEAAFYNLLSRAPRIMQDESNQDTCLKLLVGYLRLQSHKLAQVLNSGPFLHRLLVTLALVCRLETSHVTLLEDCSVREVEMEIVFQEPWKQLMFLNTSQKLCKLQELCTVLRQFADLSVITHALLDMLDSNPELSKEIILLLNTILGGGEPECMVNQQNLVKTVVNMYLQPRLWDVPFSASQSGLPVAEVQSNVVQVSLLAEGLGLLALAVGSKNFSTCLLRCLYPLLEYAGSHVHILASAGLTAVQHIAKACYGGGGGEGVTQLVCANVDYLSHHITLKLRRTHQSPGVLSVLSVVMRHTSIHVLPSLQEIIEDVLAQSYDEFQKHNTNEFLRVFLTFVTCVRGWQQIPPTSAATAVNRTFPPSNPLPPPSLLNQLKEYHQLVCTADILEDKEDGDNVNENISEEMFTNGSRIEEEYAEPEKEDSKPLAPSVQLTLAVLQRALHFLPSKDEQRQILVLHILKEGVQVLEPYEDHLLPMVHKIWSPLVNRFQAYITQPLVVHQAFLLLCTLASTSRGFIQSRTLRQVLPTLCQVVSHSADASVLKDSGSGYRLTQQYKLQRAVLSGLGPLAVDLGLLEKEMHQILVAASPYLSSRQPMPLQECCVGLFKLVSSSYPDLVWLQLVSLWFSTMTLNPPFSSPHLRRIKLETSCDETSEFKNNVSELLTFLEAEVDRII